MLRFFRILIWIRSRFAFYSISAASLSLQKEMIKNRFESVRWRREVDFNEKCWPLWSVADGQSRNILWKIFWLCTQDENEVNRKKEEKKILSKLIFHLKSFFCVCHRFRLTIVVSISIDIRSWYDVSSLPLHTIPFYSCWSHIQSSASFNVQP